MRTLRCPRELPTTGRLPVVVALGVLLTALLSGGVVHAHVSIDPIAAAAKAVQRYTVRIPNEKEVPTVKVRVEFPAGVVVSRFLPTPGWTREVEKDSTGTLVAATWSGGQIGPDEFQEFGFIARNPADAGTIGWKVYQTYQDGETVAWTGPAGSEKPAAITTIRAATAEEPPGPAATPAARAGGAVATPAGITVTPAPAGEPAAPPAVAGGSDLSLFLALGALVLALVALSLAIIALLRRPPLERT